ncbi:MAG TPA: hypothetical protein VGD00_09595 [Solirubrobacteraceae bacterium]|jgi:sporulation protein YlmC with PRC-barrel domain
MSSRDSPGATRTASAAVEGALDAAESAPAAAGGEGAPRASLAGRGNGDSALGAPVAYTALREGMPVYDSAGRRVGVIEQVVGDERRDIFEGVIVHTEPLPGEHRLARAEEIAQLRERGVLLAVERDALRVPERARRAPPGDDAAQFGEGRLRALVRRAWDRIRGA